MRSLNPGETFLIGTHEFIILKQGYDFTKVISKNLMARDVQFDENTGDYNKSALKQYVDKKIRPIILKNVGEENLIKESVPLTSLDNQTEFINCICSCNDNRGVRPLCTLKSNIFVQRGEK